MKKYILPVIIAFLYTLPSIAQDFVVIGKESKVFEQPIAKDEYTALNQNDKPVILTPGMAYKVLDKKGGWYVIEYFPGLRGMVMQNVIADTSALSDPTPGNFKVTNNLEEIVSIKGSGVDWILTSGDKTFKGEEREKIIYFISSSGEYLYSVVNLNSEIKVYNYSNSVTKFF